MPMELVIVPFTPGDRRPVVTFAFRPPPTGAATQRSTPMSDVAIVGIGMHPFGRHPISGREQGAIAARRALADAGIDVVRRRVRLRRLVGRRRRRHDGVATSA